MLRCSVSLMRIAEALRERADALKQETFALYLAARHRDTPWYAKLLVAGIVAYALSPIDLIPDFIPVLGYLDDLILVPLGIFLVLKMIPEEVMVDSRAEAAIVMSGGRPTNWAAAGVIVTIWLLLAALAIVFLARAFGE